MAGIHKVSSPYYQTPVVDFYLDVWKAPTLQPTDDDVEITISAEHHFRPDLLAYQLYGTPNLFWIFAIRNPNVIKDPLNDFTAGTKIFVYPRTYVEENLLRSF